MLRRRAVAKLSELPGTRDWLFTDEALQQASAAPVALHRSKRLRGKVIHDVTCSIGTELAALRRLGRPRGRERPRPVTAGDGAAQSR